MGQLPNDIHTLYK